MIPAIRTRMGDLRLLEPLDETLERGDFVVYETERGLDCSPMVPLATAVSIDRATTPTVNFVRKATPQDLKQLDSKWQEEVRAHKIGLEKIGARALPMKLIETFFTFDFTRLIFVYTADGRVDFRELLKDLTATFRRTRIELRQIGVRDATGLIGGVGACGRELCCATFLREFAPITIKLAKDQNLPLNPSKISGLCGRLMCCLSYEHDMYMDIKRQLPTVGTRIQLEQGMGLVVEQMVMREAVRVEVQDDMIEVPLAKLEEIRRNAT